MGVRRSGFGSPTRATAPRSSRGRRRHRGQAEVRSALLRAGSAVRNRSEIVTIATPRGPVDVLRQEMKGLRQRGSWTWFWLARRTGQTDWCQATTAREAIRKATLLPSRTPPAWLREAAANAEARLTRPPGET